MTSNPQIELAWRRFHHAEQALSAYLRGIECDSARLKALSVAVIAASDTLFQELTTLSVVM